MSFDHCVISIQLITHESFGLLFFCVSTKYFQYLMCTPILSFFFLTVVTFLLSRSCFVHQSDHRVAFSQLFYSGAKSFSVGQKVSETFYPRDKKSLKLFVLG